MSKEVIIEIPQKYLKEITCPRCNGEQNDPASEPYFREFLCTLCKGVGKIVRVDTEFYC